MSAQRYTIGRQEEWSLDNGPEEKWLVVCETHGCFLGFPTKERATDYRAYLYARLRAGTGDVAGDIGELCAACATELRQAR